jgi:hypothetical protein
LASILAFYSIYGTLEAAAWSGLLADEVLYPEYRKEPVREPVFILGNPRSGTTFLHRLLSKDAATFTTMRLRDILVAPSVTGRRLLNGLARADGALGRPVGRLADALAARAQRGNVMHGTALDEPEEDQVLLWHIWSTIMVWEQSAVIQGAHPYVYFDQKMPSAEKARIMSFYAGCVRRHLHAKRDQLNPSIHYLSKSPAFSGRVDSLLQTFPDARIVYLVRNPLQVIPSYISLLRFAWQYFGVSAGLEACNEFVLDAVSHWYHHPLERLDHAPSGTGVIVRYDDLTKSAERVVRDLYDQLGFPLSPNYARILRREAVRARAYRSKHSYSLERLGVPHRRIVAEFSDVFSRFGFSTSPDPA